MASSATTVCDNTHDFCQALPRYQENGKQDSKVPRLDISGIEERKSRFLLSAVTRMIQHVATAEGTYLLQLLTFQAKRSGPRSFGFRVLWISRMLANYCGPEMT